MSVNNDEQPGSFQSERGLFIAGLLLFFLGGLYWLFSTTSSVPSPPPQVGTTTVPATPAAQANEQSEADKVAQNERNEAAPPEAMSEERAVTRAKKSVSLAKASRAAAERPTNSPAPEAVESVAPPADAVSSVAPTPTPRPAVPSTPTAAVQVEATPLTKPATNPVLAKSETKKKGTAISVESKPVVQSAAANASPAVKRKTKNDEDVEVDL